MDIDSFFIHMKTGDLYEDIADDVKKWFDTSNYVEHDKKPLPTGKNKKVIGLFKDELGGKIIKEFVALRAKTYSYLMDDDTEHKKAKRTKKCVIKRILLFKDCLFNNHNVYTEQINKITLNSNDDERLQTFYKIATYPYGTNIFKVCKSQILSKL